MPVTNTRWLTNTRESHSAYLGVAEVRTCIVSTINVGEWSMAVKVVVGL